MAGIVKGRFDSPDETRRPDKTTVEIVNLGGVTAARTTFEPGWKWSECIGPVAGTESCQARHVGTAVSGRLHVRHEDGTETEVGPGDAFVIEPGHDGWVVSDEPYVAYEFDANTAGAYAKM